MTGGSTLNSGHLDDLTATILCAEAMGLKEMAAVTETMTYRGEGAIWANGGIYRPLKNDAQAMALVKRFGLQTSRHGDIWLAAFTFSEVSNFVGHHTEDADLNRAIVYCVAKMQSARIREGANPHSISEEK